MQRTSLLRIHFHVISNLRQTLVVAVNETNLPQSQFLFRILNGMTALAIISLSRSAFTTCYHSLAANQSRQGANLRKCSKSCSHSRPSEEIVVPGADNRIGIKSSWKNKSGLMTGSDK